MLKVYSFIICLFICFSTFAQTTKRETMLKAHQLVDEYKWKEAEKLVLKFAENGEAEAQYLMSRIRTTEMIQLRASKVRVKKTNDGNIMFKSSKKTQRLVDSLEAQSRRWFLKANNHDWLLNSNLSDEDSIRAQYVAIFFNPTSRPDEKNLEDGFIPFSGQRKVERTRKAAEKNILDAQVTHVIGLISRNDSLESIKWLNIAADNKHGEALYNFGLLYSTGTWVKKDKAKALDYYTKSQVFGYEEACWTLGHAYYDGEDVKRDLDKAIEYFDKYYIYESKKVFGMYTNTALLKLGSIYVEKKDYKKALSTYQMVTDYSSDIGEARYRMGEIYATLEQYNKAIYWLQKSDYKDASRKLREIRNR